MICFLLQDFMFFEETGNQDNQRMGVWQWTTYMCSYLINEYCMSCLNLAVLLTVNSWVSNLFLFKIVILHNNALSNSYVLTYSLSSRSLTVVSECTKPPLRLCFVYLLAPVNKENPTDRVCSLIAAISPSLLRDQSNGCFLVRMVVQWCHIRVLSSHGTRAPARLGRWCVHPLVGGAGVCAVHLLGVETSFLTRSVLTKVQVTCVSNVWKETANHCSRVLCGTILGGANSNKTARNKCELGLGVTLERGKHL